MRRAKKSQNQTQSVKLRNDRDELKRIESSTEIVKPTRKELKTASDKDSLVNPGDNRDEPKQMKSCADPAIQNERS